MGVQLNIKSEEARKLATKLAQTTGETITEAVTESLRLRLRALERDRADDLAVQAQRVAEFHSLTRGSRERWRADMLSVDTDAFLYDERGLPR